MLGSLMLNLEDTHVQTFLASTLNSEPVQDQ